MLELDGRSLALSTVADVAFRRVSAVRLADSARARMKKSRARVNELVLEGETIYGVNTGFGYFANVPVESDGILLCMRGRRASRR